MCELFVEMMFACSSMAIQVIGAMAEYSGHCSITNPPLLPIYLPPWGPTIINATCLLYWLPSVRQIIFDIANSFKAIFNQYQHLPKHAQKVSCLFCLNCLPLSILLLLSLPFNLSLPFFMSFISQFLTCFLCLFWTCKFGYICEVGSCRCYVITTWRYFLA